MRLARAAPLRPAAPASGAVVLLRGFGWQHWAAAARAGQGWPWPSALPIRPGGSSLVHIVLCVWAPNRSLNKTRKQITNNGGWLCWLGWPGWLPPGQAAKQG